MPARPLVAVVVVSVLAGRGAVGAETVCPGDCNGDRRVVVNELITGVNIGQGTSPVGTCTAADVDGSGTVSVNELVRAVNSLLDGCDLATPSPTAPLPTPTPTVTAPRRPNGIVELRIFRSNDNTLYYVVGVDRAAASAGIGAQITSVVMSAGAAQAVEEPVTPPDEVLTAFAGALSGSAVSPARIVRTGVIEGLHSNDIVLDNPPILVDGDFDPAANDGRGVLTLPEGRGTVSIDGSASVPVQAATSATASGAAVVPAATTTTIRRQFRNNTIRSEMLVFPNPPGPVRTSAAASCSAGDPTPCDPSDPSSVPCGGAPCAFAGGESVDQNVTVDDTVDRRVGNPVSQGNVVDGVFLHAGSELLVFMIAGGGEPLPINAAAAGFLVVGRCAAGPNVGTECSSMADCAGNPCDDSVASRTVAAAISGRGVVVMPPLPPTPTPTSTPITSLPGQRLQTGQTACYDAGGNAIGCAGTGQDGELQRGLPRAYVDNGDGTITDVQTGLMWEQLGPDGIHDVDALFDWQDAFTKIAALNSQSFAGHTDWRLPNANELQTLIDFGEPNLLIDPVFTPNCVGGCTVSGCDCQERGRYWSSTTLATSPSSAMVVFFFLSGSLGDYPKRPGVQQLANLGARAVRDAAVDGGGAPLSTEQNRCYDADGVVIGCAGTGQDGELHRGLPPAIIDNGDGTVTDLRTGLMWEKLGDDGSIHDQDDLYTWREAFDVKLAELNGARFAGHADWRLPNINELQSLTSYGVINAPGETHPAIAGAFDSSCRSGCAAGSCSCTRPELYWSSTTGLFVTTAAFGVDFRNGSVTPDSKSKPFSVRAVRGGTVPEIQTMPTGLPAGVAHPPVPCASLVCRRVPQP